jgi:hypothetical protein
MLLATRTGTDRSSGTARWMAPELHDPELYNITGEEAGRPTKESDVYAMSLTIWEVNRLFF